MNTIAEMERRLATLAPQSLEIRDESGKHASHEGAKGGGGHYLLTIVSPRFAGKPPMARHRMVYDALSDLMHREIHALSIKALTPDEF